MKKFLIGTVFIIPIIIVLAITATGRIIALRNPLNASRMELRNSDNELIVPNVNDTFYVDATDDTQFIIAELFPLITDQKIIYKVNDELPNAGEVRLEQVEGTNHHRIVPVFDEYGVAKSGVAEVTIYPANNVSISQTITVIVKSEVIAGMVIYNEEGEVIGDNVSVYAPAQFYCDVNPMDALDYESFVWSSSNPDVASVSKNGLVTPEKAGSAVITAQAEDKKGNLHSVSVTVDTEQALVRATSAKTVSPGADWVRAHLVIPASAQVAQGEEGQYYVSAYGRTVTVSVTSCGYGDIEFAGQRLIYTQNGPFYIGLRYCDDARRGERVEAEIESDNPAVLSVDSETGMATAHKAGTAELSATVGKKTVRAVYIVRERPYAFNLKYGKADAELGISRTRVWGASWLNPDNSYTNTFLMESSLAPGQADLVWETDDQSLATVDAEGLITFYPLSAGRSVTVRATVTVHNYKTSIYREFTFRMADNPDSVNVYDFAQFCYIAEQSASDIVMQSVIHATSRLNVRASVYGNGFLYDAKGVPDADSDGILRVCRDVLPDLYQKIVFEELWVEAAAPEDDMLNRCSCIYIDQVDNPVEIRYCILQYARMSVRLHKARNVTIEGSILGNTGIMAIEVMQDILPSYLTLRNVVMRQSPGPSIMVVPADFGADIFNKNIMPYLNIEGFLDMTNWMLADQLSGLLIGMEPTALNGIADFINPQAILNVITDMVEEMIQRPDNQYLLYNNPGDGQQYISAGGFFLGMYVRPETGNVKVEREALKLLPVTFPTDNSTPGAFAAWVDALTQANLGMTIRNPNYLLSYDFSDGKKPKYGPGDSIPQDFKLYERLVTGEDAVPNTETGER